MDSIIYSTEFDCKLCKKPATINLYSKDNLLAITDDVKDEVLQWAQHYHWIQNHQVCAICGELVRSGEGTNDLDLIQTETIRGDIHPRYIQWQTNPDRGLLTVHSDCSKRMFSPA